MNERVCIVLLKHYWVSYIITTIVVVCDVVRHLRSFMYVANGASRADRLLAAYSQPLRLTMNITIPHMALILGAATILAVRTPSARARECIVKRPAAYVSTYWKAWSASHRRNDNGSMQGRMPVLRQDSEPDLDQFLGDRRWSKYAGLCDDSRDEIGRLKVRSVNCKSSSTIYVQ